MPLLTLTMLTGLAYAQRMAPLAAAAPAAEDAPTAEVYVNDSFEAADAIRRAEVLAADGRWREAGELLQTAADEAGHAVLRIDEGHYIGVRRRINGIIAAWPEAGLSAYRDRYEPVIRDELRDLPPDRGRSPEVLLQLFERFFCTSTAGRLADTIAQLAIEAGDAALAKRVYQTVLRSHPDREQYPPYRNMLAITAALLGQPPPEDITVPDTDVRWMGQPRPVGEIVSAIETNLEQLRRPRAPDDWPIFGGNPQRARVATTDVDELGLLWRFDIADSGDDDAGAGRDQDPATRARQLTMHPVVGGGLVFVQRGREIIALHKSSGAVAWRFRSDDAPAGALADMDDRAPAWDAVTLAGDRIYAALPGETAPYYSYEGSRRPAELVCLDASSGSVIWRVGSELFDEAFVEIGFDSSPIVSHGRLYVVGRRRRSFGFEDCYLYRFNADTGTLDYRTHIGSGSTGTFGSRQATRAIPAMSGATVYVCTNLGSIAAIDAHTGAVRWLRTYRRTPQHAPGFSGLARDIRPWHFNPVIATKDHVIVLPTDSPDLLVLSTADASIQSVIPRADLGGATALLGVHDNTIFTAGGSMAAYDVAAKTVKWQIELSDEALFGRGVITKDALFVPLHDHLRVIGLDGSGRDRLSWGEDAQGGNLLALPEHILVAGAQSVAAYVRRTEIWTNLRRRMEDAPSDPLPALELAEIALTNGEYETSLAALAEAVKRATAPHRTLDESLRRRLFDDAAVFAERLVTRSAIDREQLNQLFGYAAQFAPDPQAHLNYRLRFADWFAALGEPQRAVRLYQQILRDRSLRSLPVQPDRTGAPSAGTRAQTRIATLITEHGREIYSDFEAEAAALLETGKTTGDPELLRRVAEEFPNSAAASDAVVARAELLRTTDRPLEAARAFADAYHRATDREQRPELLRRIADAYAQAGQGEHAYLWLTKAAREHPSVRFPYEGRKVSFEEYRQRLADVRDRVVPSRPDLAPPIEKRYTLQFDEATQLLSPWLTDQPGAAWSRFFVHTESQIRAFDAGTGKAVWEDPVAAPTRTVLLVAYPDKALFATMYELFAVDASTGRRRWSYGEYPDHLDRVQGDWEDGRILQTHAVAGNQVLSVRDDGMLTLTAIDTGEQLWTRMHRPQPDGSVTLSDYWIAYDSVQDDQLLLCLLDARTGQWVDAILTDYRRSAEKVMITLDEQILVATSRSLSSFDPHTRRVRWRVSLEGHLRPDTLLLDVDAVYVSDDGRRIEKFSLDDGSRLWESERLGERGDQGMSIHLQGGSVIVTTASSVDAVDSVTGLTLWRGTTPKRPRFAARQITQDYVLAIDTPGGLLDDSAVAFFYDHRNASGVIAQKGTPQLGPIPGVDAALALNGALIIQTGTKIRGYVEAD